MTKQIEKVLFYGNFGENGKPVFDGQRTKARNIYNIIRERYPNIKTTIFNTNNFKKHKILNFIKLIFTIKKHDSVFIFPGGYNSLRIVLRAIGKSVNKMNCFYPVVGGFIGEYCLKNKKDSNILKSFKGIFCETNGICDQLKSQGFENVFLSPVFTLRKRKDFNYLEKYFPDDSIIRFCTFGRVSESKGISLAIDTILKISSFTKKPIILDIYGKIYKSDNYGAILEEKIKKSMGIVNYCGPLPDNNFEILSSYHFMLFPTHFDGEGFPACVLECYQFATPVIASDWKYNKEFVNDKTGYIFELNNDSFFKTLLLAISNIDHNFEFKKNAYEYSKSFEPQKCLKPVFDVIDKMV